MGRGLIIALVLSLAANVFAAGFIAGRIVNKPEPPSISGGGRAPDHPMRYLRYTDQLPPESQKVFRAAIRKGLMEIRKEREEISRLRGAYADALVTEPFDRAGVEAARAELDAALDARRALLNKTLIDGFEALSPQDRALLVNEARARGERRRHRRGPPPEG